MKLKIDFQDFSMAIDKIATAIPLAKTSIPALQHIVIDAFEDRVTFYATNMDSAARLWVITEEIEDHFYAALPADFLTKVAKSGADAEHLEIELDKNFRAKATLGKSKFTFSYIPAEDVPTFETSDTTEFFSMEADTLQRCLRKTLPFASADETRYYLCGTHLKARDDRLVFTTTDGHRLGRTSCAAPDGMSLELEAILPSSAGKALLSLFKSGEDEEPIDLEFSERFMSATQADFTFQSRLIDGAFPDADRVIPDSAKLDTSLRFVTSKLKQALKMVRLAQQASKVKDNGSGMTLSWDKGQAEAAYRKHLIEGEHSFDVTAEDNPKGDMGFNLGYMQQIVSTVGGSELHLAQDNAENSAIVITSPEDPDSLWLLMPMRM